MSPQPRRLRQSLSLHRYHMLIQSFKQQQSYKLFLRPRSPLNLLETAL